MSNRPVLPQLTRRSLIVGLPLLAAGCAGGGSWGTYGAISDEGFLVPAADTFDSSLQRTQVTWRGKEKPGNIVVNISERRLYLVQAGGTALRYAVGVGRSQGANFRGTGVIGRKEKWPHWTPTENMMAAIPSYRPYGAKGMQGGLENPLGARALYLYRDGKDTFFRLHGTNEPESIGGAVSSGCIRLLNQDIIDLYNRVPTGTTVTVLQS